MKNNKVKKVLSFLMAAMVGLSTFIGVGTTIASAASGQQAPVYIIEFPRGGDANYSSGNWGFPQLTFKNGWSGVATSKTSLRTIGSYSGNVVYCIESGNGQYSGDVLTENGEDFFNNLGGNGLLSGDEIRLFIGRIMQYGYRGGISTSWVSQNDSDANNIAEAYATQLLIWETVVGERDDTFKHKSPSGYNSVMEIVSSSHPLRDRIYHYYDKIADDVRNHTKVPSFCKRSSGSANTYELEWDGSKYSVTLDDSNGVLSGYRFSADVSGVNFDRNGNKLTISMTTAPTSEFKVTAERKDGNRRGVIVWTDGRFTPSGGIQDVCSYAQEVSDPVKGYFRLKVSYGSCQIIKTSEDNKVEGIKFTIEGEGFKKDVVTQANGKVQIDNLMPGVYTVTEHNVDKYEPQEVRRVTVLPGQVSTVDFNNVLKRGDLQIIKSSEDNLVEGVTFHLYGTSLADIPVDQYATTNAEGVATFTDVLISGTTPYTVEEVDTAIRYVVPPAQFAPISWNEVTTRNFTNILKKFAVTVTKSDIEEGTPQGDAKLSGAVYGVFKGETLVDEYVTDEKGQFTSKEYVCDDDFTVREITPSEGYLIDNTIHKVGSEPQLYTIEHNLTANDVTEQVMKGNIAIIKHTDDGETQIETPESGATFEIYLKSSGSFEAAEDDEKDEIVCDENGFAQTRNMPYGTYIVHQTSGWEGREKISDFEVFIAQNEMTYRYLINNRSFESYVQVVKTDAETGNVIPYAGAGFKLYDPAGNPISMTFTYPTPQTIDVFYTDANGSLVTPEKLEYGSGYYIVEVQAPYGYVLDTTPIYFDVTAENASETGGVVVVKVEKTNVAQKGIITVEKTGEVFYGVNVSGSEDTNLIYQPVYELCGLEGAVYEIRAAEDIITPDGTIRYTKGQVVDTVTTTAESTAKSKELYLGKYEVQEISAPVGMVLNGEIHNVELVYTGQEIAVTETATGFTNDRQKVEVSLSKALETDDIYGIGNNGEIKNISFGLFAGEELVSVSGTAIPLDGLVEIITLDDEGKAVVKSDLPMGSYYLKELATDQHYILNDTIYPVVFEYAGQDIAKVEIKANNGENIKNELIYGTVTGIKVDENNAPLAGAEIGIFKADTTEFVKENALLITYSADDGSFSFGKAPYGNWLVKEVKQPEGYVLDDTIFEVNISGTDSHIELTITNEYVFGNISLTKVDADFNDNKLSGAVFDVYKDNNADNSINDGDEHLGTLTETGTGVYEMKDLPYGHYLVKESVAPDKYVQDRNVYSVFIEEDGKTYTVENRADVGFVNEAETGKLKIVKTSTDGKVEGFTFRVTGVGGYDRTFTTGASGEINIDNLRVGKYTISEVADERSAGYELPKDKEAAVKYDSTTMVEMHNVLRDTPDTGDNRHPGLWMALAGVSAIGIGVTSAVAYKKYKNKDK